jgi:hypothetical protein
MGSSMVGRVFPQNQNVSTQTSTPLSSLSQSLHSSTVECSAVGYYQCADSQSWQYDVYGSEQSRRGSRFKAVIAQQQADENPGGGIFPLQMPR